MSKRTLLCVCLCAVLSSPVRTYAQDTSPFHTIGKAQHQQPMLLAVEKPSESMTEAEADTSSMGEETDSLLEIDSEETTVPLMVALPLKEIWVNSPFGMRRDPMNRRKSRMHNGLDLRARYENVYSMLPGTVTDASFSQNGGYYVTVNHGSCVCSYLHLSEIKVRKGQHVSAGEKIAVSGNTGRRTTGPHLHISCRWSDTGKYFDPRILLRFVTEELLKLKNITKFR